MAEQNSPAAEPTRRRSCLGRLLLGFAVLLLLCLLAAGASALSNLTLPDEPPTTGTLAALDKVRLAEALRLKAELGDSAWPGWGALEMPIILWNRDYEFLIGPAEAPAGWEQVPGDQFAGQAYYRRQAVNPQNFAVPVAGDWAASMATKTETDRFVRDMISEALPPPLDWIVPYRLLIQPSEVQLSGVWHESFHVFQLAEASARLADAERAYRSDSAYWALDEAKQAEWETEIGFLAEALAAPDKTGMARLASAFLAAREARRQGLEPDLVDYERRLEWLEGLAKYVELESWRAAAESPTYEFEPGLAADPDFKEYATFDQRWSQEIAQMKRQARTTGETRFYYTGMAQARLLDQLMPDWQARIMAEGVWLEELLSEAVEGAGTFSE